MSHLHLWVFLFIKTKLSLLLLDPKYDKHTLHLLLGSLRPVMPPHLLLDPALMVCPNFALECFCPMCNAYSASTGLSINKTITALIDAWAKANELQKMAWALQVEDDERIRLDEQ